MKYIYAMIGCILLTGCTQNTIDTNEPSQELQTGTTQSGTFSMTEQEIQQKLTPEQYEIAREDGTETPFENEYWDNKREGIYVDILDGTPLFSSTTKYVSGTGWPSFTQPINAKNIALKEDNTLLTKRTEVETASTGNHLGHVFNDGPKEAGGLRYCLNSAALKFVSKEDMETQGYGEYLSLFEA